MTGAVRRAVRSGTNRLAARAGRGYVAGPNLGDARRIADALLERGYGITVGYWDGVAEDPAAVAAQHASAIDDLGLRGGDYVSVKAPSVGYDHRVVADLVVRARAAGVGVHFDSLGHHTVGPTLDLIESLPGGHGGLGITIPGRWRRSPADAAALAARGLAVRIVKGQWPDPDWTDLDPAEGFLAVTRAVAGTTAPVRIATHDARLASAALGILSDAGTPTEVELLFGLPVRPTLAVVQRQHVRVYVPYGHGWLPYALDGLKSHPRLMLRLVRDALGGRYLGGFIDRTAAGT
jgi:proline dehydrogenase